MLRHSGRKRVAAGARSADREVTVIKIHRERLRAGQETTLLIVDLVMLALLVVNLGWIIFDWLFQTAWFSAFLGSLFPDFTRFYGEEVRPRFWKIDLGFVAVFLTEFTVRWVVAARRGTHTRWYFYPFVRWYELLGCVPIVGLRMLRLLRLISMTVRLHKLGVIDLRQTRVAQWLRTYYDILLEEISDRVVLNVLDGVQHELRSGQPISHRIVNEIVMARKDSLVTSMSSGMERLMDEHYGVHRESVHGYLERRIRDAVAQSSDVERLSRVPMLGDYARQVLERSVTQIVHGLIDDIATDLQSGDNRAVLEELLSTSMDIAVDHGDEFHATTNEMLVDAIELIKERVGVQRWREQFA